MQRHVRIGFAERFAALFTPRGVAIWVIVTVAAAVAGPFGTFQSIDFGRRLLYWGAIAASSILVSNLCDMLVRRVLVNSHRLLLKRLAGPVLAVPLITTDVWAISSLSFWGESDPPEFLRLLGYVALISVAARSMHSLVRSAFPRTARPTLPPAEPILAPRLLKRIPGATDAKVLHLSVRDHFVEITTCYGTEAVRMRFRDALDEIDGVEGFQVHRSHWVAREAIDRVERDQARVFVHLKNGSKIPVSRNYHPVLEAQGML